MIDKIILKPITLDDLQLPQIIKFAMGDPQPDKIAMAIESYYNVNNYLIGAYIDNNMIGIIGYLQKTKPIIIRHISVLPEFQYQGIGTLLLNNTRQHYSQYNFIAETDADSVAFYQKCGFMCNSFQELLAIN